MKKLIIILCLLIGSIAHSQTVLDALEFQGKVTNIIRDAYVIPTGGSMFIWSLDDQNFQYAADDQVWHVMEIYTTAEKSKLAGIEPGATADQTDSEIETAYNNQVPVVSQTDAEAGTSTTSQRWTAQRVAQAIAALAAGSGHTIQEEGTPLTARSGLNFIGGSVTVTDNSGSDRTDVTIDALGRGGSWNTTGSWALFAPTNSNGISLTDAGLTFIRGGLFGSGNEVTLSVNTNLATLGGLSIAEIDAAGVTSLVTKEWVQANSAGTAASVSYDNGTSGAASTNLQDLGDELYSRGVALGYTPSATNGIVTNDRGADATIPLADDTNAGLLSPAEHAIVNKSIVSDITGLSGAGAVSNVVYGTKENIESWGTDDSRVSLCTNCKTQEVIQIACSDLTTDLTTGTSKGYFRMPWAATILDARVSVLTAPVGASLIVDVNENGTTLMSTTKLIIASSEKTNVGGTAPVFTDTSIADNAEITIDIDQVGSGGADLAGKGLIVTLYVEYGGMWWIVILAFGFRRTHKMIEEEWKNAA